MIKIPTDCYKKRLGKQNRNKSKKYVKILKKCPNHKRNNRQKLFNETGETSFYRKSIKQTYRKYISG